MSSLNESARALARVHHRALNAGRQKEVTADGVDMIHDIMEKHYDKATKNDQMERREDYLVDV